MPMQRRPTITNLPWDEEKGLYYVGDASRKTYLSPAAFGEALPGAGKQSFLRGTPQFDQKTGKVSRPFQWGNLLTAAVGATMAAPAVAGLFGGAGGVTGGTVGTTTGTASAGLPGYAALPAGTSGINAAALSSTGAGVGKLGSLGKGLGKIFGGGLDASGRRQQGFLDPTMLALSALKLFGGGNEGQSDLDYFTEPGAMTDPKQKLYQALQAKYRLGQGLTERAPVKLRSSYVQKGPAPITIAGLPFQIGGGFGTDPANADPSLLTGEDLRQSVFKYDPFQSLIPQKKGQG